MIGLMSKYLPRQFVAPSLSVGPRKFHGRYFSTTPSPEVVSSRKKTTILDIQKKFREKTPITMVTAYDYTSAIAVDTADIDILLVGDSLGMVMLGQPNTVGVTMDEMIHHCKAVQRGAKGAFLLGDMPFGSYEVSPVEAVRNATRLLKEGGMEAVKMEGGKRISSAVSAVVAAGIPVIGHIGLTPQTLTSLGGFKVQGKSGKVAAELLEDAKVLQELGVSAIVIEGVPAPLAAHITKSLSIPTIGIGAGPATSGQVLVFHDILGLFPKLVPKFSKQYLSLATPIRKALGTFKSEVESGVFPTRGHSFTMDSQEFSKAFPGVEFPNPFPENPLPMGASILPTETEKKTETLAPPVTPSNKKTPTLGSVGLPKEKKKIVVLGGGSMGSLVGGRLADLEGTDVWIVTSWQDHAAQINANGLTLQRLDSSTYNVPTLRATSQINEILETVGQVDLVVVMVKSPFTSEAAKKAAQLLSKNGVILTLQNGLGNWELLAETVGDPSRVIQGVTSHSGNILGTGFVSHTGEGYTTLAYQLSNQKKVSEVSELLSKAGFECQLTDSLEGMQWGKLIINSAINPLSALLRVKNGVLVENRTCRDLLGRTAKEGEAVASAKGVKLPFDVSQRVLDVAKATKENQSSMLKDIIRGTQTEIDAINGVIVKEGERLGVEVFLNRMFCGLVGLPTWQTQQQLLKL